MVRVFLSSSDSQILTYSHLQLYLCGNLIFVIGQIIYWMILIVSNCTKIADKNMFIKVVLQPKK